MQPVLVKIDVAVVELRRSVRAIYQLAEGGSKMDKALCWVFDFSQASHGKRRDLRFWYPELQARSSADAARRHCYDGFQLDWVIKRILPASRPSFSAGEVSEWFQIRHNTRAELLPADDIIGGRAFYGRQTLAGFLQQCWVGELGRSPAGRAPLSAAGRAIPRLQAGGGRCHAESPGVRVTLVAAEPASGGRIQPPGATGVLSSKANRDTETSNHASIEPNPRQLHPTGGPPRPAA